MPAPGLGRRGRPHEREVVEVVAVLVGLPGDLGEHPVERHDVPRLCEAVRAQAGLEEPEGACPLLRVHLAERSAFTGVAVDVAPPPPLVAVDGERAGRSLLVGERAEELLGGLYDRTRGDACGLDLVEAPEDVAVGRDALERLGHGGLGALHVPTEGVAGGLMELPWSRVWEQPTRSETTKNEAADARGLGIEVAGAGSNEDLRLCSYCQTYPTLQDPPRPRSGDPSTDQVDLSPGEARCPSGTPPLADVTGWPAATPPEPPRAPVGTGERSTTHRRSSRPPLYRPPSGPSHEEAAGPQPSGAR